MKTRFSIFLLSFFVWQSQAIASYEKQETYFSCEVLKHKMILVSNGKATEYSGIGKEAAVGSKLNFKLKNQEHFFSFVGSVQDTSTTFSFIGVFEKVLQEIKKRDPYRFWFHLERGSISPDLLLLRSSHQQVSLKRHSEGKWDGNMVKVKDEYVLITALTCRNAGSGLQKIFNHLTDEGY